MNVGLDEEQTKTKNKNTFIGVDACQKKELL